MKRAILIVLCVVAFFIRQAGAAEVEGFIRGGTINLTDGAINEGHKAHLALGVSLSTDPKQKYQGTFTLEGFAMSEPSDEDGEIPAKGLGFLLEGRRNFKFGDLWLYPYIGAGFRYWERDGSEKTVEKWHSVSFLEGKAGLGAEYKFFYAKAAIRRPLWIDDSGLDPGFGFESEAGIKMKKFRIGLFYDRFGFNSGNTFNINFWGGRVGYSF